MTKQDWIYIYESYTTDRLFEILGKISPWLNNDWMATTVGLETDGILQILTDREVIR